MNTPIRILSTTLLAAFTIMGFACDSNSGPLKVADLMPVFSAVDNAGKPVEFDHVGELTIVHFWATWCPPCIDELPSLKRFMQESQNLPIRFILVSVDEDQETVRQFMQQHNMQIDTYYDFTKDVPNRWGTEKYPETYVFDRQGKLWQKFAGTIPWEDQLVRAGILALAAEG